MPAALAMRPVATLMKKRVGYLLAVAVVVFYSLHQDFWFWRQLRPLVLGFIPIGLLYHAAYSVASAGLMWLLVRYCWPGHLEATVEDLEATPPSPPEKPSST